MVRGEMTRLCPASDVYCWAACCMNMTGRRRDGTTAWMCSNRMASAPPRRARLSPPYAGPIDILMKALAPHCGPYPPW